MPQADKAIPLRRQQQAFTRSRLMEAGQRVFSARGYPEATVDDIAREAGASRATFYLHFKSKCELAVALVNENIPAAVARYRVLDDLLVETGSELREQMRTWLSEWLDLWTGGADVMHALQQAAMLDTEIEAHMLRLSETLIDSLPNYFANMPEKERAAARSRALILEIMTQRIFALASMSRLPMDHKDVLEILVGMWWDVLVRKANVP